MGASSKQSKKKGPKGKRARAKAKLEQVWGESVDEDARKASKVRIGKSRLMPETTKKTDGVREVTDVSRVVKEERYDESSSESEDEETNGNSFTHFLKRIRQPDGSQMDVDSEYSSEESESEKESETESDDESIDEQLDITADAKLTADPFEAHFSKSPLPQLDGDEKNRKNLVLLTQNVRKVNTPMLNSSMNVHLSGPLLDQWDSLEKAVASLGEKKPKSLVRRLWEEFCKGSYSHGREILTRNWKNVNKALIKGAADKVFSSLQLALYPAVSTYADVLMTAETRQNRREINSILAMHVLEHVLTSKSRIQRHNRRIKEIASGDNDNFTDVLDEQNDKWRDQGYTSPKVLILFPTRGTCWTFVHLMMELLGDSAFLDNEERFETEFGPPATKDDSDVDDEQEKMKKLRRKSVMKQKGQEWNDLFGDDANDDDDFKLGLSLNPNSVKSKGKKKKSLKESAAPGSSAGGVAMKLFTEFYKSDILLASPIGLKMATTNSEGDDGEENGHDVDFLSSIDICIVARSDVLAMQNWDHVNSVLECLNRQPKNISNIDFSRVRNYFLAGQGDNWRQLIVVSKFLDPYILSTFRRYAKNIEGQLKLRKQTAVDDASISNVTIRVKQVFQRVVCDSVSQVGSSRLRYFSEHILPKLLRLKQKHTLIFIPSYFDFVSVRNLLLKQEASFVSVTEYARVSEVSRGRARFHQGRKNIMLYTGRAHFFLRHKIKGVRHVIFFGLPEYGEFYPGIVNMLNDGLSEFEEEVTRMPLSSLSLFTKYEAHQLERVVGTVYAGQMINGEKSSFLFT